MIVLKPNDCLDLICRAWNQVDAILDNEECDVRLATAFLGGFLRDISEFAFANNDNVYERFNCPDLMNLAMNACCSETGRRFDYWDDEGVISNEDAASFESALLNIKKALENYGDRLNAQIQKEQGSGASIQEILKALAESGVDGSFLPKANNVSNIPPLEVPEDIAKFIGHEPDSERRVFFGMVVVQSVREKYGVKNKREQLPKGARLKISRLLSLGGMGELRKIEGRLNTCDSNPTGNRGMAFDQFRKERLAVKLAEVAQKITFEQ